MRSRTQEIARRTEITGSPAPAAACCRACSTRSSSGPGQRLLHPYLELGRAEGLQEDGAEAGPRGLFDDVRRAVTGHEHAAQVRLQAAGGLEHLEAVHAGHLVVDQHEVEPLLAQRL